MIVFFGVLLDHIDTVQFECDQSRSTTRLVLGGKRAKPICVIGILTFF